VKNETHNLIAFGMILLAIMYLATVAAVLAWNGKYAEALGFGGLTTGLVGVIGTFKPRTTQTLAAEPVTELKEPE
jgi:hypothetical protein